MKSFLVIPSFVAVVVLAFAFFALRGVPDRPTRVTLPQALEASDLPALPVLFNPGNSQDDAGPYYEQAIEYFKSNRRVFRGSEVDVEKVRPVVDLLAKAEAAGRISAGWLDKHYDMMPMPHSDEVIGCAEIVVKTLQYSNHLASRDQLDEAERAARGAFALAYRMYRYNGRLPIRYEGISLTRDAASMFQIIARRRGDEARDQEAQAWHDAARELIRAWQPKYQVLTSVRPHVGDTLNMAQNDRDMSFRVEAILMLGVAKMNPGHNGNLRAINRMLNQLANSQEPLIRQAAEGAQRVDSQYIRSIR